MPNHLYLDQPLHRFPLTAEMEGTDPLVVADQARARFAGESVLERLRLEYSETLSYGTNEVFVLRTDGLPGGSFKFVSGSVSVAEAVEAGYRKIVSPSAGSYGIAIGQAAKAYEGVEPTVFMPKGGSPAKQVAMQELGVAVREWGTNFDETRFAAYFYALRRGARFLDPYASKSNLAATGILGQEIFRRCPDVSDVVLQFGGGSLHGGIAPVIKKLLPATRCMVTQVAGCSPFVDSVLTGEVREFEDRLSRNGSYFRKLGGVGVGKTHPMTLGIGSQHVDAVSISYIDYVYATMHDYQEEHGVLPEVAAAVGLQGARDLARAPGVSHAKIVAVLTGARPETYLPGYLAGMSRRRQADDHFKGLRTSGTLRR